MVKVLGVKSDQMKAKLPGRSMMFVKVSSKRFLEVLCASREKDLLKEKRKKRLELFQEQKVPLISSRIS